MSRQLTVIDINEDLRSHKGSASKGAKNQLTPYGADEKHAYALAIENNSAGMRALAPALTEFDVKIGHVLISYGAKVAMHSPASSTCF